MTYIMGRIEQLSNNDIESKALTSAFLRFFWRQHKAYINSKGEMTIATCFECKKYKGECELDPIGIVCDEFEEKDND